MNPQAAASETRIPFQHLHHHDSAAAAMAVAQEEAERHLRHRRLQKRRNQLFFAGRLLVAALFVTKLARRIFDALKGGGFVLLVSRSGMAGANLNQWLRNQFTASRFAIWPIAFLGTRILEGRVAL